MLEHGLLPGRVVAVISCARMLLGRKGGDTAPFREIPTKHWRRPAVVFNGREEGTFEIDTLK